MPQRPPPVTRTGGRIDGAAAPRPVASARGEKPQSRNHSREATSESRGHDDGPAGKTCPCRGGRTRRRQSARLLLAGSGPRRTASPADMRSESRPGRWRKRQSRARGRLPRIRSPRRVQDSGRCSKSHGHGHRRNGQRGRAIEHDPESACPGLDPGAGTDFRTRSCSDKRSTDGSGAATLDQTPARFRAKRGPARARKRKTKRIKKENAPKRKTYQNKNMEPWL